MGKKLTYEYVKEYFEKEVKPFFHDAWIDESIKDDTDNKIGLVGYEILFPRYFSEYKKPKDTADLKKDIAIIAGKILDLSKKL